VEWLKTVTKSWLYSYFLRSLRVHQLNYLIDMLVLNFSYRMLIFNYNQERFTVSNTCGKFFCQTFSTGAVHELWHMAHVRALPSLVMRPHERLVHLLERDLGGSRVSSKEEFLERAAGCRAGVEQDSPIHFVSEAEGNIVFRSGSVLVSGVPWGPRDPVSGGRGPRENWILYKFDQKLAVGGPRKDGRGPRAAETY
jgi:hypothetical protein